MNIKLRVSNLVKKYGSANPYYLANDLGIAVMQLDLPDSVRGFKVRALGQKYIALNTTLSESNQKVVLCHELGHARLHPRHMAIFIALHEELSLNRQYINSI